jgi:hypothetical protein
MEPLVCPLLNIVVDIKTSKEERFKENDTMVNASWKQNASA